MHFVKMHGLGNDYIYVDEFLYPGPRDIAAAAPRASDRHTGIGGDGLVLIQPTGAADCRMRMFNADGSEGRMCGNAIRCIAYYMLVRHPERCKGDAVRIETLSGLRTVTAQRDALRAEKRSLEERVRELDAELARMQLAEGLAGGSRNREKARARVNRLMREVDKCIALAEQPFDASSAPETRTAE